MVHGSQFIVHGSQFMVHSSQFMVHSSQFIVQSSECFACALGNPPLPFYLFTLLPFYLFTFRSSSSLHLLSFNREIVQSSNIRPFYFFTFNRASPARFLLPRNYMAIEVQGECRAELARAMLSRSLQSQCISNCTTKIVKKIHPSKFHGKKSLHRY